MKRLPCGCYLILLVAGSLNYAFELAAQTADVPADLEAKIEAYVIPYVNSNNFSGAILIAKGDRVLVRKGYGMANIELGVPNMPQTKFHIASVSKSFTAAAILLLEQQGKLSIREPLSKFIADYPNGQRITIHHLLVHTSGIPNVNSFPDYAEKSRFPQQLQEIIGWFKNKPLEFEPGARYSYSNSNYNLLAYIIEKTSGQPYGDFLRENIFKPLQMDDTGHDGDSGAIIPRRASGYSPAGAHDLENTPYLDWSIKTGNGSLYTTVDDLYKWDRALYGEKLLNKESKQKMFTEHVEGVGYGWFIRKGKRRHIAIGGRSPGFTATIDRFTDDDMCVITASNLYSSITHSMATDLTAIVFGEMRNAVVPATPVTLSRAVLHRYVGRYQFGKDFVFNPQMVLEVRRKGDWLVMDMSGGGGSSYLIPLAENKFLDRLYGGTVSFAQDATGKSSELIWNFGKDYKAPKLN